jgi:hypothetical protein
MTSETGSPRCLNCGAELSGPFCSQCGQQDHDIRVSLARLVKDFFAEHLGLESKVPRTLWALVSRPGMLTKEYLAGHRVRWIPPLRLYLFASVVYFLLLSLPFVADLNKAVRITETARAEMDSAGVVAPDTALSALEKRLEGKAARIGAMTEAERTAFFRESFTRFMPNAVFLLLPFFAWILYLLYRSGGRFFAEHLIFALHVHGFAFIALSFALFLPSIGRVVVQVWILAYLYLALRRVYGESRGRTVGKFAGLIVPYMLLLLAATFAVLLIIFATA